MSGQLTVDNGQLTVKRFWRGGEKIKIMVDKRVGYGYTNCTNTSNTVNTECEGCRRGAGAQGAAETAREGCCAFGKNSGT